MTPINSFTPHRNAAEALVESTYEEEGNWISDLSSGVIYGTPLCTVRFTVYVLTGF